MLPDLAAHVGADHRGEAVVDSSPDARVRRLGDVVVEARPAVRHARSGGRGELELGQRAAAEERFQHRTRSACDDAVRARIFRVHRGRAQRLPVRLAWRLRVAVLSPLRMAVTGRQNSYRYFASNTATIASVAAMPSRAKSRAFSCRSSPFAAESCCARG